MAKENDASLYKFVWLVVLCAVVAVAGIELIKQRFVADKADAKIKSAVLPSSHVVSSAGVHSSRNVQANIIPYTLPAETDIISNLREQRYEIMERQTATLIQESENVDEDAGPRSLSLPKDRIRALEKKGAMIN